MPGEALCQSKHTEAVSLIIYPQASGLRQRAADLSTVVYHCTTAACAKRHLVMRLLCRDHVHDTVHWYNFNGCQSCTELGSNWHCRCINNCPCCINDSVSLVNSQSPHHRLRSSSSCYTVLTTRTQTQQCSIFCCWTCDLEQSTAVRSWCRQCHLF